MPTSIKNISKPVLIFKAYSVINDPNATFKYVALSGEELSSQYFELIYDDMEITNFLTFQKMLKDILDEFEKYYESQFGRSPDFSGH